VNWIADEGALEAIGDSATRTTSILWPTAWNRNSAVSQFSRMSADR
jgi:hypothetical protein